MGVRAAYQARQRDSVYAWEPVTGEAILQAYADYLREVDAAGIAHFPLTALGEAA